MVVHRQRKKTLQFSLNIVYSGLSQQPFSCLGEPDLVVLSWSHDAADRRCTPHEHLAFPSLHESLGGLKASINLLSARSKDGDSVFIYKSKKMKVLQSLVVVFSAVGLVFGVFFCIYKP